MAFATLTGALGSRATKPPSPGLARMSPSCQAMRPRENTVRGTPVQVLRYGPLTTVWVDPKTGRMLRFESSNQDKTAPIVVDLAGTQAKSIQSPPMGAVVAADQLGDAWVKRGSTSP